MRAVKLAIAINFISVAALAQSYKPGPENVSLPTDYVTNFIRFATVDKLDRKIVRFLYINPEALSNSTKGSPLPSGTVLVMEDHAARVGADGAPLMDQQGRLIPTPAATALFVQEKRNGWGEGYSDNMRNGNWEYARFNVDGSRHPGSVEGCFMCHKQMRSKEDFTFNVWDFLQTKK